MAIVYPSLETTIKKIVRDSGTVQEHATNIAAKASANLAPHHKSGKHDIEVSLGRIDVYVSLKGPAAGALEFGHLETSHGQLTGRWVNGLRIIRNAANLP